LRWYSPVPRVIWHSAFFHPQNHSGIMRMLHARRHYTRICSAIFIFTTSYYHDFRDSLVHCSALHLRQC
jgi:hypothetical protein